MERILDLLPLTAQARALDLGCGRGELSLRIIERFRASVVAVDISSRMLSAARERARARAAQDRLQLVEADIADYQPEAAEFELTVMLGSGGIGGGIGGICRRLAQWTRAGGHILIGEGFWAAAPSPEYLLHLDATPDQLRDHRGNVEAGVEAGLIPLHAAVASSDEWDEYEWQYSRAIELYAAEQPTDPDVPAMLERIRRWRDGYLRWGRESLGFGVYLFRRAAAA